MIMEIHFWQNIPSMHQLPYQRELVAMGHAVTLCVNARILPERVAMGWAPESAEGLCVREFQIWEEAARIMHASAPDSVHVISGVRGVLHGGRLTRLAAESGRRACWLCEAWDSRGFSGWLRSALYAAEALRYRDALHHVFAMGETGVRAYVGAGHRRERVSRFNYVVKKNPVTSVVARDHPAFVFGFAGTLSHLKGVDTLIAALAGLSTSAWRLEIHGAGPEEPPLRALASRLGVDDKVAFFGGFRAADNFTIMARFDCLVLPSRKDGWGAVVNEALLGGRPVIVSDACGAACLPLENQWGFVFPAGDVAGCRAACARMIAETPKVDPVAVEALIGARATAERMMKVLETLPA